MQSYARKSQKSTRKFAPKPAAKKSCKHTRARARRLHDRHVIRDWLWEARCCAAEKGSKSVAAVLDAAYDLARRYGTEMSAILLPSSAERELQKLRTA